MPQGGVQLIHHFRCNPDGLGYVFELHLPVHLYCLIGYWNIRRAEVEPVFSRVSYYQEGGNKAGDIAGSFPGKAFIEVPKVVEIIYLLPVYCLKNRPLAAIVGGKDSGPVPNISCSSVR